MSVDGTRDDGIRVLHVDDDPEFADVASALLERADDRFEVETATSAEAGLAALEEGRFDCVVSDYDMPGRTGLDLLRAVRERRERLPFVLFTGKGSEEVASEAISAGVTDYIQKGGGADQYALLANRVANAVEAFQARREADRHRTILQNMGEGVYVFDADHVLRFVDYRVDGVEEIAEGEWTGRSLGYLAEIDVLSEAETEWIEAGIDRVLDGDADEVRLEVEPRLPERAEVIELRLTPLSADVDEPLVLATTRDVTERKRHERDLEAERRLVEGALGALDDLFYVVDADGRLRRWNDRVAAVTGRSEADLDGTPATELFPEDERERVRTTVEETLSSGRGTVEAELVDSEGERRPYELSCARLDDPDGTTTGFAGIGRDLSERRRREREQAAVEARYETLVENLPDVGVFLFDEDLTYRLAGGGELGAVGLSPADFEGATPHDLFPAEVADETVRHYRAALDGEGHTYEQEYDDRRYRVRTVPVRDDEGRIVSGLAVSRDVTEQTRREAELRRRNERLEEFASVVSHDLRNPLQVASGRLELAREECDSDHLDGIDDALDRSRALIDDLLALARDGDRVEDPETLSLAAAAERCRATIPDDGITLEVAGDRPVRADPTRMGRLLENLAVNAVEHGGAGVTVTVGPLADGFYVADDGPGIPPDERDRVFEAGYSTGDDGTGFGLRIVERIADAHGWTVDAVESEDGGARFEITGVEGDDRADPDVEGDG